MNSSTLKKSELFGTDGVAGAISNNQKIDIGYTDEAPFISTNTDVENFVLNLVQKNEKGGQK